ncbi:hypothetical protein BGW37DRAFT_147556 [Umbelopsis sp. PMI_123]|jgi:hypothetical protein|nr:hypothetical protein BGW37DRAFT_147556 [Umbelopsis sp. PMI_123]
MSSGISNGRVPHSTHKPNAHYSTIRHLIKSKVDSFSPETRRTLLILFRAFALGWSVSALPALLGLYIKILIKAVKTNSFPSLQKLAIDTLRKLYKGIARNGVPWLFCGSLGGHRLVEPLLKKLMKDAPSNSAKESIKDQKRLLASSFIASALTIFSVHRLFPRTGTLDITLFAAVRAGDVFAHRLGSNEYAKKKLPSWLLHNGDVIVFVLACTEIMFSWFFAPNRLPK